jgi:hypothetical protein
MLVIDYDIAAKREIVKCAIDGTAVTSIDRAQDGTAAVAHTSGAKIIMAFVPSHYTGLTDGTALASGAITDTKLATKVKAGWDLLSASGTRVSATQFTVTGDITDRLWVGKPVEFTDTDTKYGNITSFSYSSPNTTINLAANSDYALVGNPTDIYGGLHSSPVGFPDWFNWTPVGYKNDGATSLTISTTIAKFRISGRECKGYIVGGANADPSGASIFVSSPVTAIGGANICIGAARTYNGTTTTTGRLQTNSSHLTKIQILNEAEGAWGATGNTWNGSFSMEI